MTYEENGLDNTQPQAPSPLGGGSGENGTAGTNLCPRQDSIAEATDKEGQPLAAYLRRWLDLYQRHQDRIGAGLGNELIHEDARFIGSDSRLWHLVTPCLHDKRAEQEYEQEDEAEPQRGEDPPPRPRNDPGQLEDDEHDGKQSCKADLHDLPRVWEKSDVANGTAPMPENGSAGQNESPEAVSRGNDAGK